jgi:hypothetical protein
MKIINYKEIETERNPHGVEAKKIHDNENVQVVHMLLRPGGGLQFFFVQGTIRTLYIRDNKGVSLFWIQIVYKFQGNNLQTNNS